MLPDGKYEKVVIHDNFGALLRFAKIKGKDRRALDGLMAFNGRFIVFEIDGVFFISTAMGSAQTNCLLEALAKRDCKVIVKVGTCSALDSSLKEADVIVPYGALVDEGATYWRQVQRHHRRRQYRRQGTVNKYIKSKELVLSNQGLRAKLIRRLKATELDKNLKINQKAEKCMWSVDAYDCFDRSYELYAAVDQQQYRLQYFGSDQAAEVSIAGVEMECSALFASAQELCIPAAALIVVSRSRARLLCDNVPKGKWERFKISYVKPRDEQEVQIVERECIEIAAEIVKNW